MNAALGLVSKLEGKSRHLNSAPDATIVLVRAEVGWSLSSPTRLAIVSEIQWYAVPLLARVMKNS